MNTLECDASTSNLISTFVHDHPKPVKPIHQRTLNYLPLHDDTKICMLVAAGTNGRWSTHKHVPLTRARARVWQSGSNDGHIRQHSNEIIKFETLVY